MTAGNMPEKIKRVLIVDDHARVRQSLVAMLRASPDLDCVGVARDGMEAVSLCQRLRPDIILMDLLMPTLDGLTATRMIAATCPETAIILMSSLQEGMLGQLVSETGAVDFVTKSIHMDDLIHALRAHVPPGQTEHVTQP